MLSADIKNRLYYIPTEFIIPNTVQSRRDFDKKELRVLAESIAKTGILQPLTVRKLSPKEYELISGERRYRASLMVGLDELPCVVLKCNDKQSVVLSLMENLEHKTLNMFEEADVIRLLITQCRMTKRQIAEKIGKQPVQISEKLTLLEFSDTERIFILNHRISELHAKSVLKLDSDKRKTVLEQIAEKSLTISQTEQLIYEISKSADRKQQKNQTERFIIKDVRIFINTLTKAVDVMKSGGIDVQSTKTETEKYIEYNIRIPKSTVYGKLP